MSTSARSWKTIARHLYSRSIHDLITRFQAANAIKRRTTPTSRTRFLGGDERIDVIAARLGLADHRFSVALELLLLLANLTRSFLVELEIGFLLLCLLILSQILINGSYELRMTLLRHIYYRLVSTEFRQFCGFLFLPLHLRFEAVFEL